MGEDTFDLMLCKLHPDDILNLASDDLRDNKWIKAANSASKWLKRLTGPQTEIISDAREMQALFARATAPADELHAVQLTLPAIASELEKTTDVLKLHMFWSAASFAPERIARLFGLGASIAREDAPDMLVSDRQRSLVVATLVQNFSKWRNFLHLSTHLQVPEVIHILASAHLYRFVLELFDETMIQSVVYPHLSDLDVRITLMEHCSMFYDNLDKERKAFEGWATEDGMLLKWFRYLGTVLGHLFRFHGREKDVCSYALNALLCWADLIVRNMCRMNDIGWEGLDAVMELLARTGLCLYKGRAVVMRVPKACYGSMCPPGVHVRFVDPVVLFSSEILRNRVPGTVSCVRKLLRL